MKNICLFKEIRRYSLDILMARCLARSDILDSEVGYFGANLFARLSSDIANNRLLFVCLIPYCKRLF